MRLISPNNNRRELVLLSRLAQTMAIHANPRAKRRRRYSACESPRYSPILSLSHPFCTFSTSAFDSSASAVGAQWCQTIDPHFWRRVETWTRIRAVEHQGEVSLVWRSLNASSSRTSDCQWRFSKNSRNSLTFTTLRIIIAAIVQCLFFFFNFF